ELLEKETLHRPELEAIFGDVEKRPRLTMFDDFGGRIPSDKPPIKTPGELAIERGEPWPPPVPEPAFKAAIARASEAAEAQVAQSGASDGGASGRGANGSPAGYGQGGQGVPPTGPTQPDYGAPAGWHAPGWPPQQPPRGWYPPAPPPPQWQPAPSYPGQAQPSYSPYPPPDQPAPESKDAEKSSGQDEDVSRSNPPAHG
ncbi:MAG TPA: cell division protein FtsH, partial [Mycobacterium sp.]|nr:cell division protein FtsH [Mycobacterium sp.]